MAKDILNHLHGIKKKDKKRNIAYKKLPTGSYLNTHRYFDF